MLPESWEGPDAVGLARVVDGTIVVRHTFDAHRKIQTFLEELEREACEVLCMASANPEQQAGLADIDGETCEGQEDCVQLVVIVE